MNFADIFKQSFLQGYASSSLTVTSVVSCMVVVTLVSGYIFMVYRLISRDSFYNLNFNIALPAIAVITAAIILTIQASIVISLGMVGALSIVRFRTAVKDPMDLVFSVLGDKRGHHLRCGAFHDSRDSVRGGDGDSGGCEQAAADARFPNPSCKLRYVRK